MESSEFFAIIDTAREGTQPMSASADPDSLEFILGMRSDSEIAEFATEFARQQVRLNRWSVWGAGYVIAGGMGDDSFLYFRSWLIGKGERAVEQALSDPDGLAIFIDDDQVENELLAYVAIELLEERGINDSRTGMEADIEGAPAGEPFDEETVDEAYPKLAAR